MLSTDDTRREETSYKPRQTVGWTQLHSWVFIIIVALGVGVIAMQNRYHYLSPLGLGKAYRIDKLFGGIQEFDPSAGWITAQLAVPPPSPALSMMEPPGSPMASRAVPMNMPAPATPTEVPAPAHHTEKGFQEQPAAPSPPPPGPEQTASQPRSRKPRSSPKRKNFKNSRSCFPNSGRRSFNWQTTTSILTGRRTSQSLGHGINSSPCIAILYSGGSMQAHRRNRASNSGRSFSLLVGRREMILPG